MTLEELQKSISELPGGSAVLFVANVEGQEIAVMEGNGRDIVLTLGKAIKNPYIRKYVVRALELSAVKEDNESI